MSPILALTSGVAALLWLALLVVPWQPWRVRERLEGDEAAPPGNYPDITVLIPARDEAEVIGTTLASLREQAPDIRVVLVDDNSSDGTADIARESGLANLRIIQGSPLPSGWTGKLWALEQGRQHVDTPLTLLLDADIALRPGTIRALREKQARENRQLVSLMARLRMQGFWEKLLMPAFIYFFRLLYPFALSNAGKGGVAAAAGGCILVETRMLEQIGGFGALREALIDDCTLARKVQEAGGRTWIGSTRSAISLRGYDSLGPIWLMVTRTAFTQLGYSPVWLLACTALFLLAFAGPWPGLLHPEAGTGLQLLCGTGLAAMLVSYLPTLRFYRLSPLWALALPLIAALYLAMTWSSALRYWRGIRSQWRGRIYDRDEETPADS